MKRSNTRAIERKLAVNRKRKLKRYGVAIVVTVEAQDAEEAFEKVSGANQMTVRDNPSETIEADFGTDAFELPADYAPNETQWHIPEILWGDGMVNVLNPRRTVRG